MSNSLHNIIMLINIIMVINTIACKVISTILNIYIPGPFVVVIKFH